MLVSTSWQYRVAVSSHITARVDLVAIVIYAIDFGLFLETMSYNHNGSFISWQSARQSMVESWRQTRMDICAESRLDKPRNPSPTFSTTVVSPTSPPKLRPIGLRPPCWRRPHLPPPTFYLPSLIARNAPLPYLTLPYLRREHQHHQQTRP